MRNSAPNGGPPEVLEERPEGVWFTVRDGRRTVRCLVERSAWEARALRSRDMTSNVRENWRSVSLLAHQKLSLEDAPVPAEIHLTADDLYNVSWFERNKS